MEPLDPSVLSNEYVSIFLRSAFANYDPTAFVSLFFLFMGRMLPVIALSPFFGARVMPNPVKFAFAVSLFAIYVPQLLTTSSGPLAFNLDLIMLFFKEALIGVIMGTIISIPFIVAQNAGIIIDHQRGGASLMVNDPTIQNQSSPIGTLFNLVLIFIFFMIDGPFLVLDAISISYDVLPADRFLNPVFFTQGTAFWNVIVSLFNRMMVLSAQLAGPGLIAILMTDVFLGIANRLAPQVQITFLGLPLKSLLALAVVGFGWQLFTNQLVTESFLWLKSLATTISYFVPGEPGSIPQQ